MNTQRTELLGIALDYHRRGWAVIPCRCQSKIAARNWKRYQRTKQTEAEIEKLFASEGLNIAVICGEVSGGLTVRDFDDRAAYRTWAALYPEHAKTLPTVKTGRGFHVYFRSGQNKIEHFPDGSGELRGGGYCLLPPSIHPDGTAYTWEIEPNGELPEIDFDVFYSGLQNSLSGTERLRYRDTEDIEDIDAIKRDCTFISIEDAIEKTLPELPGQRNRRLFDFARILKSNPALTEADPETLRPLVEQWHARAKEIIDTKDYFTTWADFLYAFEKVKFLGVGPMLAIKEKIERDGLHCPAAIVEQYPDAEPFHKLASICLELQRLTEPEPFFLSCRTAGTLLSIPPPNSAPLALVVRAGWIFAHGPAGQDAPRHALQVYRRGWKCD